MSNSNSIIDLDENFDTFITAHNDLVSTERRSFLKLAGGALAGSSLLGLFAVNPVLAKRALSTEREVRIFTPSLNESSRIIYWVPGEGYIRESLKELSWALRDRRNNTARMYDPHVLDQLYALRLQLDYKKPTHILSGYRSPETNAMLRRTMRGVAQDSLHMKSKAMDLRMPGVSTGDIRTAAISLRAGGVGYYGRSNFVHIDSGQLRSWGR
ncbi:M15A protease-related family periplasmic protein [Gammaproteobacteria bacterium]|nr:M15A protease-related family periplasmic protein [Gammaproteobacteria bacterium]